jgi:2-keto-3-deoxy-L-fuconate dehydrogenase
MTNRLAGKTVLVTAAAQGMGRSSALAMAREGATVHASDIRDDLLATLADEARAAGHPLQTHHLDVTDARAIDALVAALPPLDVLFNCAGFVHQGTIFDCSEDDWDFSFAINVRSMYRTIRAALPRMLDNGGGSIINMASICSSQKGFPNRFVYGTTKAAVIGMTKSVAADFIKHKIRCNAICPGTVQTPSLDDRINSAADPVEARKAFIARQPLGRLGTAEEIAALALYLASDESAYTTGTIHVIDGGLTL